MAKCIEQVIKRGLKDSVDHLANVRTLAKAKNCDKPAHWRVLITKERATLIPYDGKGRGVFYNKYILYVLPKKVKS